MGSTKSHSYVFIATYFLHHWHYTRSVRRPGENVCTTLCEGNIIGGIWKMTFFRLWSKAANGFATNELVNNGGLNSFSPVDPWEIVAMDSLEPLPKTVNDNQFDLIMMYYYSKLRRAVLKSMTPLSPTWALFIDSWIISYGMLAHELRDDGS